jgi:hypothetical protein
VELNGPSGSTKLRPVEQGNREIDDRGVQTHQFVLESELFLPLNLVSASIKQLQRDALVELPGTMLIGISQGGTTRCADAQMFQFSLTAS